MADIEKTAEEIAQDYTAMGHQCRPYQCYHCRNSNGR
jgi:hypothetical protein